MGERGITVKEIPPRTVAYLKCRGPWRQLPEILSRLDDYISRNNLQATGPASGIYYNTPGEVNPSDLEWEVFYPVETDRSEPGEDTDDFGIKQLPESKYATIIHRGLYRKASFSYQLLEDWIKSNELEVCGPSEEVYISAFGVPDEEQVMEIRLPVKL